MREKGQIWIETVLYTLIGITLMGVVLAFVMPKITETKNKLIIDQTIESLNEMDSKIYSVLETPGNVRRIEFSMKKGALYLNCSGDNIMFVLDELNSPYSEPGAFIERGRITILTEQNQKTYSASLTLNYNADLTCSGENILKKFGAAPNPYTFSISNLGDEDNDGRETIEIKEIS